MMCHASELVRCLESQSCANVNCRCWVKNTKKRANLFHISKGTRSHESQPLATPHPILFHLLKPRKVQWLQSHLASQASSSPDRPPEPDHGRLPNTSTSSPPSTDPALLVFPPTHLAKPSTPPIPSLAQPNRQLRREVLAFTFRSRHLARSPLPRFPRRAHCALPRILAAARGEVWAYGFRRHRQDGFAGGR